MVCCTAVDAIIASSFQVPMTWCYTCQQHGVDWKGIMPDPFQLEGVQLDFFKGVMDEAFVNANWLNLSMNPLINANVCSFLQNHQRPRISPIHLAVMRGNLQAVKALIEIFKVDIDVLSYSLWHPPSSTGLYKYCSYGSRTPLHMAIQSSRLDIVETLLQANASPSINCTMFYSTQLRCTSLQLAEAVQKDVRSFFLSLSQMVTYT